MRILVLLVLSAFPALAFSQSVSGYLYDEQHQPLIGGSILLLGTNTGVATNSEGFYFLRLSHGPHKLVASFMGYENDTIAVSLNTFDALTLNFSLHPLPVQLREYLIFSKKMNSAEEIVLNTILKKEEYVAKIRNYEYSAYSKTNFIVNRDSAHEVIGGITEVQSRGYFQAPSSFQEVVLAKRQTANFSELYNVFSSGKILSALDDVMNIDELAVISPLNKNALKYYHFEMIDTTYYNGKRVFNIALKPLSATLPLFEGRISIIDDIFTVVDIALYGRDRIKSTMKTDIVMTQSFREFENMFWFPVRFSLGFSMDAGIPGVKPLRINQESYLNEYVFNAPAFGHDFSNKLLVKAYLTKHEADSIWNTSQYLELSKNEREVYKAIDSSMEAKNFFIKFLIRLPGLYLSLKRLPLSEVSDFYRFNRIEGNFLGAGMNLLNAAGSTRIKAAAGYGFGDAKAKFDAGIDQYIVQDRLQLSASVFNTTRFINGFYEYRRYDLTLQQLVFNKDYADYFYSRGWRAGIRWNPDDNIHTAAYFSQNTDRTALITANWSLFNKHRAQRLAVPVTEGRFSHLDLSFSYDNRKFYDYGWGTMQNYAQDVSRFEVSYETAPEQLLKNAHPYQQLHVFMNMTSKLSPYINLNISAEGGYVDNDSLVQKNLHLPGAYGSLSNPHLFRTLRQDSYAGDRYAAIYVENNFKNSVFTMLCIPFLENSKYDLFVYGNYGWMKRAAWPNGLPPNAAGRDISEAGFGIGNILFYFRFDFTWRIAPRQATNFAFNISTMFN